MGYLKNQFYVLPKTITISVFRKSPQIVSVGM